MRRAFNASSPTSLFRPTTRKARHVRPRGFRPMPLRLEDRTLLSTDLWTGAAGDNSWDTAANWVNAAVSSDHHVPTASDDAVIDNTYTNVSGITVTVSASSSVNSLSSQASVAINGSLSVASTSAITGSLSLNGTLSGSGSVTVTGLFTWSAGAALSGTGTLDARGGIAMEGDGSRRLYGWTLNNYGEADYSAPTVAYVETLHGAVFHNESTGTLNLEGPGQVRFFYNAGDDPGGPAPAFYNDGSLVKTGAASDDIGVPFTTTGSVHLEQGGLSLGYGSFTGLPESTGSIVGDPGTALALACLDLDAASSITADVVTLYQVGDAGSYAASGGTTATDSGLSGPVTSVGSYLVASSLDYSPAPGVVPTTITVGTLSLGGNLSGSGSVTVTGLFTWSAGAALSGTGTLDARGGIAMEGDGSRRLYGWTLNNYGEADYSAPTVAYVETLHGAVFHNESTGTLNLEGPGQVRFFYNAGDDPGGPAPAFYNDGALIMSTAASDDVSMPFVTTGTVHLRQGNLSLGMDSVTNFGTLTVDSGTNLDVGSFSQTAGSTVLNGGAINGGPLNISGGTLTGTGTINANVVNSGQVIPGGTGAAGILTINGGYSQTATGTLVIDIGGTTAGSQYDQLAVSGTASLGGSLNVALINGFRPAVGNGFQVLSFGSHSGTLASFNGLNLGGGLFLDPAFSPGNLTLDTDQVAITGAPAFPLQGIPISLAGSVAGPSAGNFPSTAFSWTVSLNGNPYQSGSGSVFSFTPNLSGSYLVTLTVADSSGGTGTVTLPIAVVPSIYVLNATASGCSDALGQRQHQHPGSRGGRFELDVRRVGRRQCPGDRRGARRRGRGAADRHRGAPSGPHNRHRIRRRSARWAVVT